MILAAAVLGAGIGNCLTRCHVVGDCLLTAMVDANRALRFLAKGLSSTQVLQHLLCQRL